MASLNIIPYKPLADTYRGGNQFPTRSAFRIGDQKNAPPIEPGIPLVDVPQPLSIAVDGFPKHEKSSNTTSDVDHLPLKSRGSHGSAGGQSLDKGALVWVDSRRSAVQGSMYS